MDYQKLTYDVSRCYLHDNKRYLPDATFDLILGWIRSRDYQRLAACSTDPVLDLTSPGVTRVVRQISAFFSKNKSFTDPVGSRLAALLSFEEGEKLCEETNHRLDSWYDKNSEIPNSIRSKIEKMSVYAEEVLGPFNDFLEQLPELIKVTAGATATRSRRKSIPFLKVNKRIVCTPGAFPFISALSNYFGYGEIQGKLVSENRVVFVPKSWKTDRTIACEAEGNSCLQLAFDKYAKNRLRRIGVDLSDQTRNQRMAKEGSLSGRFATVDLSMASDTLAYNTVRLLLNEKWFNYLRSIRSQYYTMYVGQREAYHKFSSMGNGATFSLETLVFSAACYAVGSKHFSVYGDDIIIETELYDDLLALLAFLGFVPNTSKSFSQGPFRESCGKDWYLGIDVTPIYIRDLDRRKAVMCHLVNSLLTIVEPGGKLIALVKSLVTTLQLPFVPFSESTISGVWLDPHIAYSQGLIKVDKMGSNAWIPRTKAFVASSKLKRDWSMRSLFLWYLGTIRRKDRPIESPFISSRYPTHSHKFVRKWVHWRPVAGAPEFLFLNSEYLVRES